MKGYLAVTLRRNPIPVGLLAMDLEIAFMRLTAAGHRARKAFRRARRPLIKAAKLARGHLRERQSKGRRRHVRRLKAGS